MSRSYTSARREHHGVKPRFELDGVEFTAEGNISALDMSDMAMRFANVEVDGLGAATAFAEFYQAALGAAVYRRFLAHTREHHTGQDTLFAVMNGLVEDYTARPTEPPSLSQPGRSTTGTSSTGGSSSLDIAQYRDAVPAGPLSST